MELGIYKEFPLLGNRLTLVTLNVFTKFLMVFVDIIENICLKSRNQRTQLKVLDEI